MSSIADDDLKDVTKRIMILEDEVTVLKTDIKEVYAEAKAKGADVKVLKKTITAMKIEKEERLAQAEQVEQYLQVIEAA